MNFRLDLDKMVTCSDASTTGGGVCCSQGLTAVGRLAAKGELRGRLPCPCSEHAVLLVGLFDGVGALRVAMDLQDTAVLGYVSVESVECNPAARRVVESHYPGVEHVDDVTMVTPGASTVLVFALLAGGGSHSSRRPTLPRCLGAQR